MYSILDLALQSGDVEQTTILMEIEPQIRVSEIRVINDHLRFGIIINTRTFLKYDERTSYLCEHYARVDAGVLGNMAEIRPVVEYIKGHIEGHYRAKKNVIATLDTTHIVERLLSGEIGDFSYEKVTVGD